MSVATVKKRKHRSGSYSKVNACDGRGKQSSKIIIHPEDDIVISPCPSAHTTFVVKTDKRRKHVCFHYWIRLDTYYECTPYIDEETCQLATETYKRKVELIDGINKPGTLIKIKGSEYTSELVPKFYFVPQVKDYAEQSVDIDPYILGTWLGDGTSTRSEITSMDVEIIEYVESYAVTNNIPFRKKPNPDSKAFLLSFLAHEKRRSNIVSAAIQSYDLRGNKHIPKVFLENSIEVRVKVLAGLLDTDGSRSRERWDFIQKNKRLCEDVLELCKGLGMTVYMSESTKTCTNAKDGPKKGNIL